MFFYCFDEANIMVNSNLVFDVVHFDTPSNKVICMLFLTEFNIVHFGTSPNGTNGLWLYDKPEKNGHQNYYKTGVNKLFSSNFVML